MCTFFIYKLWQSILSQTKIVMIVTSVGPVSFYTYVVSDCFVIILYGPNWSVILKRPVYFWVILNIEYQHGVNEILWLIRCVLSREKKCKWNIRIMLAPIKGDIQVSDERKSKYKLSIRYKLNIICLHFAYLAILSIMLGAFTMVRSCTEYILHQ